MRGARLPGPAILLWAAALIACVLHPASAQLEATFSPAAMDRLVAVSDAAISPDGSAVVFVASRVDLDNNRYRDELWIAQVRTRHLLRFAGAHTSFSTPVWSPDGSRIAVVADGAGHTDQLFVLDPRTGSMLALTSGAEDVEDIAWRPDGSAIAFTRRDATHRAYGASAYRDAFEVTDEAYLSTSRPRPLHLWLRDLGGRERRLTRGAWSAGDAPPSWSPDGKHILYLRAPNAIHSDQGRATIRVLDVATGSSRALTSDPAFEDAPIYSPDGKHVLFLYPRDGDPMGATDALVADANGRNVRSVTRELDRHVTSAAWMPDGTGVLVKVYDGTSGPLVVVRGGTARRLQLGSVVNAEIFAQPVSRNRTIAFVGTQAKYPSEVYVLLSGDSNPVQLTSFNAGIAALKLGRSKTVFWESDGFREQGVLTYPPSYDTRKTYPLVLRIHGGPTETSLTAFEPFYQLAAARGYLVFAPNYRGSSNLGNAFEHAIFNDASAGPGRDIMNGVDAVEKLGIVEPSHIGVSGWSYGGQLTSWMIGHYPVFACAVTGAAVNDLVLDYAIADDEDADRAAFSRPPFADDELATWQAQSPMTYFKAMRTPLLMLGNVYDIRVPIAEQYEMFHALRDNGVPVRFYVYPSGGHLPNGPVRLDDAYRRWLDWFDRYLK